MVLSCIYVNIIILIDTHLHFSLPSHLFSLTIPKQQYKKLQKKQQEQVTKKFSEWKQAHLGMEP